MGFLSINGSQLYGYFPNPKKSWLVTKEDFEAEANKIFDGCGINITCAGRPYLGSPIRTDDYVFEFMESKVNGWVDEIGRISEIGLSQPHAAFAALTHGLMSRWSFICRTVPGAEQYMKRVETEVQRRILPKW